MWGFSPSFIKFFSSYISIHFHPLQPFILTLGNDQPPLRSLIFHEIYTPEYKWKGCKKKWILTQFCNIPSSMEVKLLGIWLTSDQRVSKLVRASLLLNVQEVLYIFYCKSLYENYKISWTLSMSKKSCLFLYNEYTMKTGQGSLNIL